jgi:hypothetical protein
LTAISVQRLYGKKAAKRCGTTGALRGSAATHVDARTLMAAAPTMQRSVDDASAQTFSRVYDVCPQR